MPVINLIPEMTAKEIDRFLQGFTTTDGCWIWAGNKNYAGYGRFKMRSRRYVAHRIMWELVKGQKLTADIEIDHACLTKSCLNPAHLRMATRKQNMENHAGALRSSKSGVRGVSWRKKTSRWVAQISHHNKVMHIGYFINLEDAEAAVIAKRNELHTNNDADRSHLDRVAFLCPEAP